MPDNVDPAKRWPGVILVEFSPTGRVVPVVNGPVPNTYYGRKYAMKFLHIL